MAVKFTTTDKAARVGGIKVLVYGRAGCHAAGHPILMFDGKIKPVEEVKVGDQLMGPDSRPRDVLALARGRQEMRKITPIKGESFVVNADHIFPVMTSSGDSLGLALVYAHNIEAKKARGGQKYKMRRAGVEFPSTLQTIPAYILGLWLGDGNSSQPAVTSMDAEIIEEWCAYGESLGLRVVVDDGDNTGKASTYYLRNSGAHHRGPAWPNIFKNMLRELNVLDNKHIPHPYLTGDRRQRLDLLAGLLDTDGHLFNMPSASCCFEITQKNEVLADNIVFLCRSLGFAAYKNRHQTGCARITISGDINQIPCKLSRKQAAPRRQAKDVLHTGISAEILPEDDYFGFTLSGDHLYLDGWFNIHHNTGKTTLCATAPGPLIISAESGLLALRKVSVPVAEVYSIQDVRDVYEWCKTNAAQSGIQTVCLDSLSEIAEQVLSSEKKKTKDPRQAYGGLIEEMIKLVKDFRDLPQLNVMVTAKEASHTNPVTGVTQYGPKAPGQTVGPELPYLFDEVFHASVGKDNTGKTYHYLRTRADSMVDAKDRSGVLDEIEYPDLTHIFNKIRGA